MSEVSVSQEFLDAIEKMSPEERAHLARSIAITAGKTAFLEGIDVWKVDLSKHGIDESVRQEPETAERLRKALGITSDEAQVLLGARYAWWHYERGDEVYHVAERKHLKTILSRGLSREGFQGGDDRGIFFISNLEDAGICAYLLRFRDPVVIAIEKRAITTLKVYHDGYKGDHRISAMYVDQDHIEAEYLRFLYRVEPYP